VVMGRKLVLYFFEITVVYVLVSEVLMIKVGLV